jgi:hypothetical protein
VFQHIAAAEEGRTDLAKIRNYRTFALLASHTGLRPSTLERLTVGQFRTALREEVSMINIIVQSVSQLETGIATAMNTIFRTIGGVIRPTIAGLFLALYVSPLVIQTARGPVMGPLLPNATAFNYIFLTALGVSLVGSW